jgi:hypothetical protein
MQLDIQYAYIVKAMYLEKTKHLICSGQLGFISTCGLFINCGITMRHWINNNKSGQPFYSTLRVYLLALIIMHHGI